MTKWVGKFTAMFGMIASQYFSLKFGKKKTPKAMLIKKHTTFARF
jgi:hypothetical protein